MDIDFDLVFIVTDRSEAPGYKQLIAVLKGETVANASTLKYLALYTQAHGAKKGVPPDIIQLCKKLVAAAKTAPEAKQTGLPGVGMVAAYLKTQRASYHAGVIASEVVRLGASADYTAEDIAAATDWLDRTNLAYIPKPNLQLVLPFKLDYQGDPACHSRPHQTR